MTRAARAIIDTRALQHNLQEIRKRAPASKIMAVVKANGYGHGIVPVAQALQGADAFAVACLAEALQIRNSGCANPILLLEGVFDAGELSIAARQGFEIVVHNTEQLNYLSEYSGTPLRVWLKMDTGMNRLGFKPEDYRAVWEKLQALNGVMKPVCLMSHFANADIRDADFTRKQIKLFNDVTAGLPGERSMANTAGILDWKESHLDWVRPGLGLFGASPFAGRTGGDEGLQAVMTVVSELIAVKHITRGAGVGYGSTWSAPEDMPFGVAAFGYGDGYPRHAGNGTPVLVNGRRVPLIGRVSMDMIAVDLREQANAGIGDPVVLWGGDLAVEEVAAAAETISYELLCGVTQRVKFDVQ